METRSVCPAQTRSSEIVAFMQFAWARLQPGATTPRFKLDRTGPDHETLGPMVSLFVSTGHYGTAAVGFTVREETRELDRGHYTETQTSLRGETFGLPNGESLRISWGGETVDLSVHTGDSREREVAREFDRQFDRPPSESESVTLCSRAMIALRRGHWDLALEYGHMVLKHRPKETDALLAVGVASGATGDLVTAEIALTDLLEVEPNHVDALYNLAQLRRAQGNDAEALSIYGRARESSPDNHAVLYQMATLLEASGRLDEARAAYEQAVAASPNPKGSWGYSGMDFTAAAAAALERLGG